MGTVFKKTFTKPLPAEAEVYTREGHRLARWKDSKGKTRKAAVTLGNDGLERIVIESGKYIAKYRDGAGIVRTVSTGCKDETAARSVLGDLERRAELVKSGVMTIGQDAAANHQGTPLAAHFDAFNKHLQAKGTSLTYRTCTRSYLDRLAAECPLQKLGDVTRESLESWLVARHMAGAGAKSRNAYRGALVTFCNWCVVTNRLIANPVAETAKANENADHRRQRRSLTPDELAHLLDVARRRPILDAATVRRGKHKGEASAKLRDETKGALDLLGRERALIYKTLILTGLRKGELASLTVAKMYLDGPLPYAALGAAAEKNRQGSEIMLREDLAADLRLWLADKLERLQSEAKALGKPIPARLPGDTPLFIVPKGLVRILDRDLRMAGIPKRDERGRTVDVHALRTTFGTLLNKGGVAPRTAQAAMRHSDIRLTMGVYTDPKLLDVAGALDTLPSLPLGDKSDSQANVARATGTDGLCHSSLAPLLAPTPVQASKLLSFPVKTSGEGPSDEMGEQNA